ncbi:MAG: hypothetical protein VW879_10105, partial [Opitutae bacterium]
EQKWTIELINDIAGDDMSVSQFIRTAIKEKINGWKERKRMDGVSDIDQMVQRHIDEERKAFEEEKALTTSLTEDKKALSKMSKKMKEEAVPA